MEASLAKTAIFGIENSVTDTALPYTTKENTCSFCMAEKTTEIGELNFCGDCAESFGSALTLLLSTTTIKENAEKISALWGEEQFRELMEFMVDMSPKSYQITESELAGLSPSGFEIHCDVAKWVIEGADYDMDEDGTRGAFEEVYGAEMMKAVEAA